MDKKEQTRLRVQRYRLKRNSVTALQGSVTSPTPNSVTEALPNVTQDVTQYPAILYALADMGKRAKLRCICESLKRHGIQREVRYGIFGPTMDVVAEYLEAF